MPLFAQVSRLFGKGGGSEVNGGMWEKSKFGSSVNSIQLFHSQKLLGELEHSISKVKVEMVGQGNVGLQANLDELRRDLGSFFQVQAKGALVRATFSMLKEMDAPSLVWKER
jgi:hypothetical protein